jgi:hypothetical protein
MMKNLLRGPFVVFFFCGCSNTHNVHKPTVCINMQNSVSYSELSCGQLNPQNPQKNDCAKTAAFHIKNEFVTLFQTNPACHGIVTSVYDGTGGTSKLMSEWFLDFTAVVTGTPNVASVDWQRSSWQVIGRDAAHSGTEGSLSDLHKAVTTFCDIVNGKGGAVVQ